MIAHVKGLLVDIDRLGRYDALNHVIPLFYSKIHMLRCNSQDDQIEHSGIAKTFTVSRIC